MIFVVRLIKIRIFAQQKKKMILSNLKKAKKQNLRRTS